MGPNSCCSNYSLSSRKTFWTLVLVCLLAFALRLWGISFGLPGVDHGDESEVVNHAVRFGSGDLNPHRFQYGTLVQYLLFMIYGCMYVWGSITGQYESVHRFALHYVSDPSLFYLIARGLSAGFGAATVVITYRIGRMIRGEDTGFLAALMLALCYQHVIHSHYATVDAAVTFFFTCAVYRSLALLYDNRLSMYLCAGFCTGLAAGTKFNGVMALVAFSAAHLSTGRKSWYSRIFSREGLLGLAAAVAGHFLACPYFYLDFSTALNDIISLQAFHASSGFNLWYYLRDFSQGYWGIPTGIICVMGMVRFLATRHAALRILAFTALAVICFASFHRYVEAKYILCAFPAAAVLGAAALVDMLSHFKITYRPLVTVALLLLLLVHPLYLILRWDTERAAKSITLESKEWIEEHIPPNAKILLDNAGNAGPKLANTPENLRRQYERAREHKLLKAELLKLQMEIVPPIYYNIVEIDSAAGSRADDYQHYRLWQDTDEIGKPPSYYCDRGYDYIVVSQRYFTLMVEGFTLMKEFTRGQKGLRIYAVNCTL